MLARPETTWRDARDPRGATTREFTIARPSRRPVTGAVWLPQRLREGGPVVACGHGASGDRYQTPIPLLASWLTDAGYPVVAMDGPVHGLRQEGPGGRAALAVEMQRPSVIDDMVEDWQLALRAVRQVDGVGAGPLAYFGLSMGSLFGIPLLATGIDVRAAVLGLLGTSGPATLGGHVQRVAADAERITCPTLFLMQLEDELFDRPGYLALFDALAAEDKRLHANPGLHPDIPYEELTHALEFLTAHLEGRAKREILDPIGS